MHFGATKTGIAGENEIDIGIIAHEKFDDAARALDSMFGNPSVKEDKNLITRWSSSRESIPVEIFLSRELSPRVQEYMDTQRVLEARIELHQRLALPLACVLLAIAGIPLGTTTRRAGKSGAVVLTVGLAFLYWMGLISMISLARQGTLPAGFAVWLPNTIFAVFGIVMMTRLETPGDRDVIGAITGWFRLL